MDMVIAAPDVETASEGYARRFAGEVGRYFLAVQAETWFGFWAVHQEG